MFDSLDFPRTHAELADASTEFNDYCRSIALKSVEGREWRRVTISPQSDHAVSDCGEIIRLTASRVGERGQHRPVGHVVPERTTSDGYKLVDLRGMTDEGDRVRITSTVHRVVTTAFLGPRLAGMQVAHGDGNPANNYLWNLRYATAVANAADKRRHGTTSRGSSHPLTTLDEEAVVAIREARAAGESARTIADRFGTSRGAVDHITAGRNWSHVGGPITNPRAGRRKVGAALTMEKASAIIAELTANPEASRAELGRQFGVSGQLIGAIATGRAWVHLRT